MDQTQAQELDDAKVAIEIANLKEVITGLHQVVAHKDAEINRTRRELFDFQKFVVTSILDFDDDSICMGGRVEFIENTLHLEVPSSKRRVVVDIAVAYGVDIHEAISQALKYDGLQGGDDINDWNIVSMEEI